MSYLKELYDATKRVCSDYKNLTNILTKDVEHSVKKEEEDQKAFDAEFDEIFSQIK